MPDLAALHDALSSAAEALHAILSGSPAASLLPLFEAERAADEAFPSGSPEAEGLALVLLVIGDEALERAA